MKYIIYSLFIIFFLFIPVKLSFANEAFSTNIISDYKINETGQANITNKITLINLDDKLYSKKYILKLSGNKPTNISAFESGKKLNYFTSLDNHVFSIIVDFDDAVIGKGAKRYFLITYTSDSIASRTGEVWNITIPKIINPESFDNFKLDLSVPTIFGQEAYITPDPIKKINENNSIIYTFLKEELLKHGVSASFGKYQTFSFNINYLLQNKNSKTEIQRIAIPPDTSIQKIFLNKISPKPINIEVDDDNNWLASFQINTKDEYEVKISGYVQIFATPRNLTIPSPKNLLQNLKSNDYWNYQQENIQKASLNLDNIIDIYNFVTTNLYYDYERINPNESRYGASKALLNPNNAICTDFTDLFITLARLKGIPAREVIGYAYSENPKIQPLSKVSDIFHSWVEYWDNKKNIWISVDPTWGSTTKKDYINKFDLNHFALVIHGKDPLYPLSVSSYPKIKDNKNIEVTLDKLPYFNTPKIEISFKPIKSLNIFKKNINIILKNVGNYAIYDSQYQILFDNNIVESEFVPVIPPQGSVIKKISVPIGIFALKTPDNILIRSYRSEYIISNFKYQQIVFQLVIFFIIIIFFLLSIYYKSHKYFLIKNINIIRDVFIIKIKKYYEKIIRH